MPGVSASPGPEDKRTFSEEGIMMEGLAIPTLETDRLRLRSFRDSDHDDYAALCADPEVSRYLLTGRPFSREAAWRFMAFHLGHWALRCSGFWAVEEKETGTFVGRVGFSEPPGWPGLELAGALLRRYWGRGYSLEAGRAALRFAFETLGKDRVVSCILPANRTAIRVVERLGETLERKALLEGKEFLVYGIDRGAWEKRRNRGRPAHGTKGPGRSDNGAPRTTNGAQ